jgi:hypothetical protein
MEAFGSGLAGDEWEDEGVLLAWAEEGSVAAIT